MRSPCLCKGGKAAAPRRVASCFFLNSRFISIPTSTLPNCPLPIADCPLPLAVPISERPNCPPKRRSPTAEPAASAGLRTFLRKTPQTDEGGAASRPWRPARRLISIRRNSPALSVSRETTAISATSSVNGEVWPSRPIMRPEFPPLKREDLRARRREAEPVLPAREGLSLARLGKALNPPGNRSRDFPTSLCKGGKPAARPDASLVQLLLLYPFHFFHFFHFRLPIAYCLLPVACCPLPVAAPPFAKRTREDEWRGGAARRSRP